MVCHMKCMTTIVWQKFENFFFTEFLKKFVKSVRPSQLTYKSSSLTANICLITKKLDILFKYTGGRVGTCFLVMKNRFCEFYRTLKKCPSVTVLSVRPSRLRVYPSQLYIHVQTVFGVNLTVKQYLTQ